MKLGGAILALFVALVLVSGCSYLPDLGSDTDSQEVLDVPGTEDQDPNQDFINTIDELPEGENAEVPEELVQEVPVEEGVEEMVVLESTKTFEVHGGGALGVAFDVSEIKVNRGDTVKITFTNDGGTHNFMVEGYTKTEIKNSPDEQTIEFIVDTAGEFPYYCEVSGHRAAGMEGTLIVE